MGDGQHVWASAEWVSAMRHLFIREESDQNLLVLCGGLPEKWLRPGEELFFGPGLTPYGSVSVSVRCQKDTILVSWEAQWRTAPNIEIHLPGTSAVNGETSGEMKRGRP
mgnify:FL=1